MKIKDAKYFGIKLSPHRIKNDKGQLIITGCEFARTGKQKYHSSELTEEGEEDKLNKFIYLDRPVEEVSDSKTVASFEGAPVTLDHPKDDVKVGVNWNNLAKGFATNVKYIADSDKEGHLQADFIITDADLIKKIENHEIEELSAGYNCEVDDKDWVQRHIRGNHIAVVTQARAGHQARLLDKAYKSTSKSLKTLKIGDKVVEIADSYSYTLEYTKGKKVKCTDYYTYGKSGKKEFVCTIKDEANPKNVIMIKINGKWKTWGGTNKDKLEEDSRYEALVKKYGKENLKFVPNKDLDKVKAELKDSKESDARVLKALENLIPEFKKLDEKYAPLVDMQNKYWNSYDGYRSALHSGKLSETKYKKMQAQSVKANEEYLELIKKWNKLCEQTTRKVEPISGWNKGVATGIKSGEDIHFPEDHYYGNTSFERFSYMLNNINKILSEYPKGTGNRDWTKAKDSDELELVTNPIFEKREAIDNRLRKLFDKPYFEVEGFMNGNDSDEGSIYVVDYSIRKDKDKPFRRGDFDDYDDYLQEACDYLERKYEAILGDDPDIESVDIDICDWDHSEDWNIDFHIYCKGVTR